MFAQSAHAHKDQLGRRRFPRVFLLNSEENADPISGILLALPDRMHVPILSISMAGMIIPASGIVGQLRLGQVLECKLKFAVNLEPVLLRLRVLRLTAQIVSLAMDSLLFEDRLKIEQVVKDQIIFSNLRLCTEVPAGWRGQLAPQHVFWWNGPFDTNLLFCTETSDPSSAVVHTLIEYDGIILSQDMQRQSEWFLKRSAPTIDESRGYAGPWFDIEPQKIIMGASWRERLLRLLTSSEYSSSFAPLVTSLNQL